MVYPKRGNFKLVFSIWVGILQRGGWWDIDSKKIEVGSAPKPPTGQRLGLYHIGIKVGDSLKELTNVKRELTGLGISISGMSDHTVSQSIYIMDPDGNEVELYVDDPNIDWKNEPNLVMSPIKPLFLRD